MFLELNVRLSTIKLTADFHTRSTDKHQYLHYKSVHPAHTKRFTIDSQALRMNRICSYKTDFQKHCGYEIMVQGKKVPKRFGSKENE